MSEFSQNSIDSLRGEDQRGLWTVAERPVEPGSLVEMIGYSTASGYPPMLVHHVYRDDYEVLCTVERLVVGEAYPHETWPAAMLVHGYDITETDT